MSNGKPIGPICFDCGLTCESFVCKGLTIAGCVDKYNANNKHNDVAPQFDAAWKVGTGMSRKKWGPSDVGGRTECGMRIEFPKILVFQKDFETVVDVTTEDCAQNIGNAAGIGVGEVPDLFGFGTSQPGLGIYIDEKHEAILPAKLPRYTCFPFVDTGTFQHEYTLQAANQRWEGQGTTTFNWVSEPKTRQ